MTHLENMLNGVAPQCKAANGAPETPTLGAALHVIVLNGVEGSS